MENKNLKNILVAAGLAVFAGVLTLGASVAFGSVDAPTQNPADASLHSPRFNDVDVNGGIVNTTTTPNPAGGGSAPINNPVVIDDEVTVTSNLTSNSNIHADNNMSADGIFSATGDASFLSNVSVTGNIKNSFNNQPLTIDDGLNIAGDALVNGAKLTVANTLDVGNDLHVVGKIQNPSAGYTPITINDSLIIDDDTDATTSGNATLKIGPSGHAIWMGLDKNEIMTNGDNLYINYGSGQDVVIGKSDVNSDLEVSGKTRAKGIGDYSYVSSVNKTISKINNNLTGQNVVCPANYRVVSCYTGIASAVSYDNNNVAYVWGKDFVTTGNYINPAKDTCTAYVVTLKNLAQEVATFSARAVCYNPNSFEAAD